MGDSIREGRLRGTSAQLGPRVIGKGVLAYSTDEDVMKVGNGVLTWSALPAIGDAQGNGPLYSFSDATSAAGITAGQVRVNNATPASITAVYVAQADAEGVDRGPDLALFSAGGYFTIGSFTLKITSCADSGTYYTLTGTYLSGVMPGDGSEIRVTIAPSVVTGEKKAAFRISQAGTSAPTIAETYYNTLGETPTFSYGGIGVYSVTWPVSGANNADRSVRGNGYIDNSNSGFGWFASHNGDILYQLDGGSGADELGDTILHVTIQA